MQIISAVFIFNQRTPTMNRPTLLILILFIFSLPAICQHKLTEEDGPSYKYSRENFALAPLKDKAPLSFHVNAIEVLDIRQDTSKFGYFRASVLGAQS